MPIIIWGSRGVTSTKERGEFYCPQCDALEEYALKQIRPFFTLFFIPIFPIGGGERYVECRGCGGTFREEVLEYEPPSEMERYLGQIYGELQTGTSLEVAQQKLINAGMNADQAAEVLEQMCEGKVRTCACGHRFHRTARVCTHCGAEL
jgi:hypothetical protein